MHARQTYTADVTSTTVSPAQHAARRISTWRHNRLNTVLDSIDSLTPGVAMTTMNAASLLPLEMTRHLHRAPPALLPPLQPPRSPPPPPPNFGLCGGAMTAGGGRSSPPAAPPRPRPSSASLMALGGAPDKPSGGGGGGGAFLGFHGGAPTAASSADNNTCRLIDYRNAQVAAFHVSRRSHRPPPLSPAKHA